MDLWLREAWHDKSKERCRDGSQVLINCLEERRATALRQFPEALGFIGRC
jgi:hypothetical protein